LNILSKRIKGIRKADLYSYSGKIEKVVGLTIQVTGIPARLGALCNIHIEKEKSSLSAEVVGFDGRKIFLMPLGSTDGIASGNLVTLDNHDLSVGCSDKLLGRVIDGLGNPIDSKGEILPTEHYPLFGKPISPLSRGIIDEALETGTKVIDCFTTLGKGQKIGIFAGSGVGKSTLMGMLARSSDADVNVIALIGERGREVKEFIDRDLKEGLDRSVVVAATSDQPPLVRREAAFCATAIAEFFRDMGKDVLLVMDSVTRFAMAQREIGLSIGEPPSTKGYTPSVFSLLPRLMERAGKIAGSGSITAIYTVLVDADDFNEPISDACRSILDGHIILSREIAERGLYPPVDVNKSISRLMPYMRSKNEMYVASKARHLKSIYNDNNDLIKIGAYKKGTDALIDEAVIKVPKIDNFLMQDSNERFSVKESFDTLSETVK